MHNNTDYVKGHGLGRVNAVNMRVVRGGPRVGDFEAGIAARLVGAGPSVLVGGIPLSGVYRSDRDKSPALREHERQGVSADPMPMS
jgi:hypothetical protein